MLRARANGETFMSATMCPRFVGGAWRFFPPLRGTESHQDMSDHRSYRHNLSSCANKA